ncbi:MAG: hypothetical protein ABI693_28950, partial [Bryobacteraceae bacterium]
MPVPLWIGFLIAKSSDPKGRNTMATTAQITANRANAKNSTGPVTDEGKQHSAHNSTSHGLTSKDVSIPADLAGEFE